MCALAALVTGEQHPLLTVIAEHSVALLAVVRAMVDECRCQPAPEPPRAPPDGRARAATADGPGRYQHIPVTVEE